MANTKRQNKSSVQHKTSRYARLLDGARAREVDASVVLENVWKEEIDALQGMKLGSEEEALSAVADKVLQRLALQAGDSGEIKTFLMQLLGDEPEIMEELRRIFRLNQSELRS